MLNLYFSIKTIGYQWYWWYEYLEFNNYEINCYINNYSNLNELRLLETDNRLIIPFKISLRLIVPSLDVQLFLLQSIRKIQEKILLIILQSILIKIRNGRICNFWKIDLIGGSRNPLKKRWKSRHSRRKKERKEEEKNQRTRVDVLFLTRLHCFHDFFVRCATVSAKITAVENYLGLACRNATQLLLLRRLSVFSFAFCSSLYLRDPRERVRACRNVETLVSRSIFNASGR